MNEVENRSINFWDALRREAYFLKIDVQLAGLPNKEVKRIKRELRGEITAAAHDVGMKEALDQAGQARTIAADYLEAHGTKVPRVWSGIVAFAVLLYGWLIAAIAHLDGMINAARQLGSTVSQVITSRWLLLDFHVNMNQEGIDSFGFGSSGWSLLIIVSVFVIVTLGFMRIWRVWTK